jgi:hypothetical protein
MGIIQTKKGELIIVDNSLLKKLKCFTWYVNKMGYAVNDTEPRKTMHRFIMNFPKSNVDHINGNKLDNRKKNLRLCNQSQNTANSSKRKTNKAGYKGVSWNKRYKKWEAYLTKDYKHVFLGYHDTKEKAALAYNSGAMIHFGNFSRLNVIK